MDSQNLDRHCRQGAENAWGTTVSVPHADTATEAVQESFGWSGSYREIVRGDEAASGSAASKPRQHQARLCAENQPVQFARPAPSRMDCRVWRAATGELGPGC